MRARLRIALAIVAALSLHVAVSAFIDRARLRARPAPAAPPWRAVEVALWTSKPPPAAPRDDEPPPASQRRQAPTAEPPTAELPAVRETAGVREPPGVVERAPSLAPASPASTSPAKPRSLLERVLAGASAGPAPSLDVLDPSRRASPDSDAARARRKIQALASAASARGAPSVDAGSLVEQLEPLEGGGYRYATGGFVATIHVDGSVTFVDKDHREGLLSSGLPGRDADNLLEPYGPAIEPYQRVDGRPAPRAAGVPIADSSTTLGSGSFDPTAALLRAQGQDPYQGEKTCFLDDTAPLRADLREAWERAQLAGLRLHLERLWFDDALHGRPSANERARGPGGWARPAVERRAALFAAWDECREEAVGLLARQLIESFVRQHLPAGSEDAYPTDELASLNARRNSTATFAPYG